jgi:hypothetical protein
MQVETQDMVLIVSSSVVAIQTEVCTTQNEKGLRGFSSRAHLGSVRCYFAYVLMTFTFASIFWVNRSEEILTLRSRLRSRTVVASSFFSTTLVCTGMP